ncbi:HEAT repeat domain-containing protein [Streptomyces xanthophaeus]|uniref:HEAT repeat domain-containing protein n=1 Tax=Streptomyces xanthophaeus TaxID=67385 RepID=UPI0036B3D587
MAQAFDEAALVPGSATGRMASSKSHIDRIFTAQARPKPPVAFTVEFLRITSLRAGLTQQEFKDRCAKARALLEAAMEEPAPAAVVVAPRREDEGGTAVLRLERDLARMERDLERALRTEERLRYSLHDAKLLLSTLFQITTALREIIVGNDLRELSALRSADAQTLEHVREETRQALTHKSTAQHEADRVTARMRVLEGLWDRARTEIHRLAAHPDLAHAALAHPEPGGSRPLATTELFTQAALDDIAAALTKANEVNTQGEETLQTIASALDGPAVLQASPDSPAPNPPPMIAFARTHPHDDELAWAAIASASTIHLEDHDHSAPAPEEAVPEVPESLMAFARLAGHPSPAMRQAVTRALVTASRDPAVFDLLKRLSRDPDPDVRRTVALAAAEPRWKDDRNITEIILSLAIDPDPVVRARSVMALARQNRVGQPARSYSIRVDPASALATAIRSWTTGSP